MIGGVAVCLYVCMYTGGLGCSLGDDDYDLTAGCRADRLHRDVFVRMAWACIGKQLAVYVLCIIIQFLSMKSTAGRPEKQNSNPIAKPGITPSIHIRCFLPKLSLGLIRERETRHTEHKMKVKGDPTY